jgi:hypothetical protein
MNKTWYNRHRYNRGGVMYLKDLGDLPSNTLNSINLVQWYINVPLNAGVQCYNKAYIVYALMYTAKITLKIQTNGHSHNYTNSAFI